MTDTSERHEFSAPARSANPFSQWQRARFIPDGVRFKTAQQTMMYHKAMLFDATATAIKVLATSHARKQKALGRPVRGFDATLWDKRKGI